MRAVRADSSFTTFVVSGDDGDMLYFDNVSLSDTTPRQQTYMGLMAHLPLLAQRDPRDVLLICYGAGIASPIALAQALGVNPAIAGSASGFYGFAQMGIGAICAGLAGIGSNPALAASVVLLVAVLMAQAAFWFALKAGDAASPQRV